MRTYRLRPRARDGLGVRPPGLITTSATHRPLPSPRSDSPPPSRMGITPNDADRELGRWRDLFRIAPVRSISGSSATRNGMFVPLPLSFGTGTVCYGLSNG